MEFPSCKTHLDAALLIFFTVAVVDSCHDLFILSTRDFGRCTDVVTAALTWIRLTGIMLVTRNSILALRIKETNEKTLAV